VGYPICQDWDATCAWAEAIVFDAIIACSARFPKMLIIRYKIGALQHRLLRTLHDYGV
jgi:hypothetical protein